MKNENVQSIFILSLCSFILIAMFFGFFIFPLILENAFPGKSDRIEKKLSIEGLRSNSIYSGFDNFFKGDGFGLSQDDVLIESEIVELMVDENSIKHYGIFSRKTETVGKVNYSYVLCPADKTYVVSAANDFTLRDNASFFEEAEKGDHIFAKCNDPQCISIGDLCVIKKKLSDEKI